MNDHGLTERPTDGRDTLGVVVVGAGSGSRLGGVDKAFLQIAGLPLIAHSVRVFQASDAVSEIVLVVPRLRILDAWQLRDDHGWTKVHHIVGGGASRQLSVKAGLDAGSPTNYVAIHDAARPLISVEIVRRGFDAAIASGAAIAAIPVRDTLKTVDPSTAVVGGTVDRSTLWSAQTPQVFLRERLIAAYAAMGERAGEFTDDAGIVEAAGFPVSVFAGSPANSKVTHADDVPYVEGLLRQVSPVPDDIRPDYRVGTGYDIHRLVRGRRLVLGGVQVESEVGLLGHSDGDVVVHAVIDALLGAVALGDIGQHFPSSDARFRDADSIELLRTISDRVRHAGFAPTSLDVTVVCERPRLAQYLEAMRLIIGTATGIPPSAVSVKAKTNEGLDAVGRGEAIAVHAVGVCVRCDKHP